MRSLLLVACLLPLALMSGCDSETPTSNVFVGSTASGEVFAASIWNEDSVLVYTCGRDGSLDDATAWLSASPQDMSVEVTDGEFNVVITREDALIRGSLTNASGTEALDLRAIRNIQDAGIFSRLDGDCRTAAIAMRRNGELLIQGAHFCTGAGTIHQVTPVLPPELLGERLVVSFDDGSGVREVTLDRIGGI